MRTITILLLLGVGLISSACKGAAQDNGNAASSEAKTLPKTVGLELKFLRTRDKPQTTASERQISAHWTLHDPQGGKTNGFDHLCNSNTVVSWAMEIPTNVNFAIVVPSTNHWWPVNGCGWATNSPVASWPAVLPARDGKIHLQFRPGTNAQPGDHFHYKIVVLSPGFTSKNRTTTQGEDFPPDSDPDIIDTTIVWSGSKD
jgi:hypothetical protein